MVGISRRAVPCRQAAEQGKAPGFLLRSLKSMWSLLQGFWLPSRCLASLLPLSYSAQQAERGTLLPLPSAPCARQMGQALTLCISLSLQMARPIQVKPADSESRGGSCHLSLFLLWQLCACEGGQAKRQGPDPTFLSPQSGCRDICVCRDLGGKEESLGIGFDQEPSAWHSRHLREPQVRRVILWLPTRLSFPAL